MTTSLLITLNICLPFTVYCLRWFFVNLVEKWLINKNLKNPLMLSVAYGLHAALMAMRLKASFHASPDAIMALHAKHRQQQRKNPPFGLKNSLKM